MIKIKHNCIQCFLLMLCLNVLCISCQSGLRKRANRDQKQGQETERFPSPAGRSSSGGVIDGNGGEYIHGEHNPWFVGTSSINYCIKKSENFSMNLSQTSSEIAAAFAAWKDILTAKNFQGVSVSFVSEDGKEYTEIPNRSLILDFKEVPCNDSPSLVFNLGVFDDEITNALKYSASMTVGFALRTDYDERSGLAKGFIWISPDKGETAYQGPKANDEFWQIPHLFRNVILHEIGHVFGFQHIPFSIMDARLPARAVARGFDTAWNGEEFRANQYLGEG